MIQIAKGIQNIFRSNQLKDASSEFTPEIISEYNQARPNGPQPKICFAPFKNIYFGHRGKASACCFNRSFEIGEYPHQSIHDIWFGEKADELRQYIANYNLDHGCDGCKAQILARNFEAAKAKQYDEHKLNENGYPSVMEFELNNTCNLECVMCNGTYSSSIRKNREQRPPLEEPYDEQFIDQLKDFLPHLEEVKFYGGEPFLIDLYYQIWELLPQYNPNVRVSVQTNATILNQRVKRLLDRLNFHINISIDSLEKENYEKIRKNASYEKVMENVEFFRQYCQERDTFIGISACAMQQNWWELPGFVKYCNQRNIPLYFHTVFQPAHCSILYMGKDQLAEILEYYESFDFTTEGTISLKNKRLFEGFKQQVEQWHGEKSNSEAVQINNFSELKQFLIEYVNQQKLHNREKKETIDTLQRQIDVLQRELNNNATAMENLKNYNFQNEYFIKDAINGICNNSIEDLKRKLAS